MHRAARALALGEINPLEASSDKEYAPDWEMADGDAVAGQGWTLGALSTPGHMANHLAFTLAEETSLFSGDHVMAWSTSVVAPPDGAMSDYMASLDKLRGRGETIYWPGHGGPVRDPQRFVRALAHHRRQREASILNRLAAGDTTIPAIVSSIYQNLKPALVNAAGLSVFAHLEDLVMRGEVITDAAPRSTAGTGSPSARQARPDVVDEAFVADFAFSRSTIRSALESRRRFLLGCVLVAVMVPDPVHDGALVASLGRQIEIVVSADQDVVAPCI